MVRSLQDRTLEFAGIRLEDLFLDRRLGIPREEHREAAVRQATDNGFVVRVMLVPLLRAFCCSSDVG